MDPTTLQTRSCRLPSSQVCSHSSQLPTLPPCQDRPRRLLSVLSAGLSRSPPSQTGPNEAASTWVKICKVNPRVGAGGEGEAGRNAARGRERKRESTL